MTKLSKGYALILILAIATFACLQLFAEEPAPACPCENLFPMNWTVSSTGLNEARELQLGTGHAYTIGKNKIRVNLIENSPAGLKGYAAVIEFKNNTCFGQTDMGTEVYLNLKYGGDGTLLWLGPNNVRRCELSVDKRLRR